MMRREKPTQRFSALQQLASGQKLVGKSGGANKMMMGILRA
jgi:hypothetical protein